MTEAERFFLADIGDVNHVGDGADDLEQVEFFALFEHSFQFVADVEMIFDGLLAAAGDDEDLVAARGHGFFHAVLDDGLIHQREHFFGLGFGCGQEAGAEAGCGENGFADFHRHRRSCHLGVRWLLDLYWRWLRQRLKPLLYPACKPRAAKPGSTICSGFRTRLVRWRNELLMRFPRWRVAPIPRAVRGTLLPPRLLSKRTSACHLG